MIINNIEEFIEQILICYDEYKEETTNYKQIILKFKETRSFMIEELKKVICGERLSEETANKKLTQKEAWELEAKMGF
ncbi:MAG: hypothetical protein WC346_05685 [Methanogenium sp.]|jgi:hypothetical protein